METIKSKHRKHLFRTRNVSRSVYGSAVLFVLLVIMGAFMALPMVFIVSTAFKPINELFMYPPRFLVRRPTLDNFILMGQLAKDMWVPFSRYAFNSALITFGGTAAYVFIASLAAYPLAKYNFKLLKYISVVVVWAILFRPEVMGVPQYIVISGLKMINTYWAAILPTLASSFGVFLMTQFISTVPDAILEASEIDGAGEMRKFFIIVMPIVKPAWFTLIIFTFQAFWNTTGLQFIYRENLKTLPTMLQQITSGGLARAGASAAVALVLMLPPVLIFLFVQASVIETMSHSGIK